MQSKNQEKHRVYGVEFYEPASKSVSEWEWVY